MAVRSRGSLILIHVEAYYKDSGICHRNPRTSGPRPFAWELERVKE